MRSDKNKRLEKKAQKKFEKLKKEEAKKVEKALKEQEKQQKKIDKKNGTYVKPKKEKKSFSKWFKGLKAWKKVLYIFLTVLLVAVIAFVSIGYSFVTDILDMMKVDEEIIEEPTIEEDPDDPGYTDYDLSLQSTDGFINICILGLDARDMSSFVGTRSDVIMIASINQSTGEVTLTSVFRDTFTKIGNTSTYQRVNTGIFFGGIDMALQTINQTLDLNIDKYVVVNFNCVVELVDAIGGVEIDVEQYEIEAINTTMYEGAETTGHLDEMVLVTEPGLQTLNGVQALSYGRIRYNVGSDTKRTERQRKVITACINKLKTMKIKEIKNVIYQVVPMVKTNLKLTDILALGVNINNYTINTGSGFPYSWCGATYEGMSLIFPRSLYSNVKQFHESVFGQSGYQPSSRVTQISAQLDKYFEIAEEQEQGLERVVVDGKEVVDREGNYIYSSNGVIQGYWKLNDDGTIYLDSEGYPVEEEMVTVGNYIGMTESDARNAIEATGTYVNVVYEDVASSDVGKVISQDVSEGTVIKKGLTITITVSQEAGKVTMVSLIGMDLETARAKISELGLTEGTITPETSDGDLNKVTSQSVSEGTEIYKGTSIDITYRNANPSSDPDPDPDPDPTPDPDPQQEP